MVRLHNIASRIFHDDRRLLRFVPLFLLSLVYRGIIALRNLLYDAGVCAAKKIGCKVINVGNITVGGTGKTPMVIMLAGILKREGFRPVILSRGYGGKRKGQGYAGVVSDGHDMLMGPDEAGDEPVLMAKRVRDVPVIVGKERVLTGRLAVERFGADVLILDDGFQHRRLFRDLNIVLLDSERPFGNGFMLPRGGLREPSGSLQRADMVVMTSTKETENPPPGGIPQIPVFSSRRKPVDLVRGRVQDIVPLMYLKGKRVCAFSGIAEPDGFRKILEPLCGEVVSCIPFPDHHVYASGDVEHIRTVCRDSGAQIMVTTEKDGIKLTRFPGLFQDVYLLRISMEMISTSPTFEECIFTHLKI